MRFLIENYDYEELEYEFDLERPVGVPDYWSGDQRYETEHVYYTYRCPKYKIEEYLMDKFLQDIPDDQIDEYLEEHYDDLVEEHMEDILRYFEDDAEMDAYQNA